MSDQIVDTKEPKSDTRSLQTDTEGRAVPPWQGGRNCCDGLKFNYVWLSAKWEVLFPILHNLQYLNTWLCVQSLCRIINNKSYVDLAENDTPPIYQILYLNQLF